MRQYPFPNRLFGERTRGEPDDYQLVGLLYNTNVNNGISRRSWARNEGAIFAIKRAMEREPLLKVTIPELVDADVLDGLI